MQVDTLILLELVDDPADEHFVNVVTAKVRVAIRRFDLNDSFADLEDRDVERTTAKVEHGDRLVLLLIKSVGQRSGRRFVDDTQNLKACDLARILGGLTLCVVKIRWNRDDGLFDLRSKIIFRRLLQFLQNHRCDFRRAVLFALGRDAYVAVAGLFDLIGNLLDLVRNLVELAAHKTLDRIKRILRVRNCLTLCDLADQTVAVLCKCDDRRCCTPAFAVSDNDGFAALHDRNDRVRRSKVNTDYFAHILYLPTI